MPEIDSFRFGAIVINGKKHKHDVLIFPDGTVLERKRGFWRLGSHSIKKEEVGELIEANPDAVVIGTGAWSRAKLDSGAESALRKAKMEMITLPSSEAVQKYNEQVREGKRVAALVHITC